VQLQKSYWESFMGKVRQAFTDEETPIALYKDVQTGLMIIIKKVCASSCVASDAWTFGDDQS
jgi:hypothetical protein